MPVYEVFAVLDGIMHGITVLKKSVLICSIRVSCVQLGSQSMVNSLYKVWLVMIGMDTVMETAFLPLEMLQIRDKLFDLETT